MAEDIEYERGSALARGWKTLWAPAVASSTDAGHASAGVVVMAGTHIGMAEPPGGTVVVPGRVCAAMVEVYGIGWLVIYSVYGHCGEELGERNWALCNAIAHHAAHHGLQWIAAGDWNFEPATVRASGWLTVMNADVIAAGVAATTHSGSKQGRHIDYFLASRGIAALGPTVTICADANIRTHDALRLTLPASPRQFVIRRMVRAQPFPRALPIGPRQLLQTPSDVIACARAACAMGVKGDADAAAILIDQATSALLTHAENALAEAYMLDDSSRVAYMGRANGIRYALGPLLGPKVGMHGTAPATARRLRRIQDAASALGAATENTVKRIASCDGWAAAGPAVPGGDYGDINGRAAWMVPCGPIAHASDGTRTVPYGHVAHLPRTNAHIGNYGIVNLAERSRAAIHAGHHAAAAAHGKDDSAEIICAAYGNELKGVGRWLEWCAAEIDKGGLRYDVVQYIDCARGWICELVTKIKEAADPCESIHRVEKAAAIRRWAREASCAGAAAAHRWTRIPSEWRPDTVEELVDGAWTITADPGAVVEEERIKWAALWSPDGTANTDLEWGNATCLARPSIEQFRRAARSFPRKTGVGVEGITPSDFDALDDDGIESCISVLLACEAIGYIPKLLALVIVKMIPKKDGGRRPIGLMPSLYRIWGKVRADDVRDWERRWAREYFAAGPGRSAESAAWRAAFRAELAAASRADSASVLWDLLKCFEHGRHTLLADEVHAVGFPIAVARMAVEMYKAERRLLVDEAVSGPIFPTRGFMAGCSRALALIKVVMVRRMDVFVSRHPRVCLDLYVDDVEMQAVGTLRIADTLASAVDDLEKVLCDELGFALAHDKAQVVASTQEIAEAIAAKTGGRAGKVACRAVKLGVEMTSGKKQGRAMRHRRARLRKALSRQRRLTKFKRMGGAASIVARRGVIPAATFGKRVGGVSNAELAQLRRLVASATAPNTKGSSQALKLLLDGDPAEEANAAPLVEWAIAAWSAAAPKCTVAREAVAGAPWARRCDPDYGQPSPATGADEAPCWMGSHDGDDRTGIMYGNKIRTDQLHGLMKFATEEAASGSWDNVRGPATAAALTARRLGWRFDDGVTVIDEYGTLIDMSKVAPTSVRNAVNRATGKCVAADAAARWGRPEFSRGIWVRPIRTALGRLPPSARAVLRRAWTGGYWSRARLADCALVDDPDCERCGARRDDAYHRIWECSSTESSRDAFTTPQMRAEAARVSREDWRFTRGLAPNAWALLPRPRSDYAEVHVGPNMEELRCPITIDGPVFVDGSAFWPSNPDARRAGWSIVMINDAGDLVGAIYGHLPWAESDEQTPGQAEMYALRRAAELSAGPLRIFTDYREAVEGISKGPAATTGPRAKHAAHWRAFWTAVEGEEFQVIKVKGHITASEVEGDEVLRWRRRGNAWADRLAKLGARAHFTDDHWRAAQQAEKDQEVLTDISTWIGRALDEWPQEKQVRRKPADRAAMIANRRRRRNAARAVGGHRLLWTRDGWRCKYCGTESRTASGAKRLLDRPCPGHTAARLPRQEDHGPAAHVLWTAEADATLRQGGPDVTWCSVCGAYSSTKLYKLRGRCTGPATGAALTRLKALRGLRHPVLGYVLRKPHRATDEFLDAVADRGDERRRLYDEAFAAAAAVASPAASGDDPSHVDVLDGEVHEDCGHHDVCGMAEEMRDDDSMNIEDDVFGHGGSLDNELPRCDNQGSAGAASEIGQAADERGAAESLGEPTVAGDERPLEGGDVLHASDDTLPPESAPPRRRIMRKRPSQGTAYDNCTVKHRRIGVQEDECGPITAGGTDDPDPRAVPYGHVAGLGEERGKLSRAVPGGHAATQPCIDDGVYGRYSVGDGGETWDEGDRPTAAEGDRDAASVREVATSSTSAYTRASAVSKRDADPHDGSAAELRHRLAADRIAAVRRRVLARCAARGSRDGDGPGARIDPAHGGPPCAAVVRSEDAETGTDCGLAMRVQGRDDPPHEEPAIDEDARSRDVAKKRRLRGKGPAER